MKVVDIEYHPRKQSCTVSFECGTEASYNMDLLVKYSMKKGMDIDDKRMNMLKQEQMEIDVKQVAYNYASYKGRSERQVRDKLIAKGFNDDLVERGLIFLKRYDLLDDERFAIDYIRRSLKVKRQGRARIYQGLMSKGIDRCLAESLLEEHIDECVELEKAREIVARKQKSLERKPLEKRRSALFNHLRGKGYSYDIINEILKEYSE